MWVSADGVGPDVFAPEAPRHPDRGDVTLHACDQANDAACGPFWYSARTYSSTPCVRTGSSV